VTGNETACKMGFSRCSVKSPRTQLLPTNESDKTHLNRHCRHFCWMRHEVARTVVCYGHIVNKPAVPSAESIGTGVTGNGRVGSCRDNVPHPSGCGNDCEIVSVTAIVKAVGGLDWMTRPNPDELPQASSNVSSQRRGQGPTKMVRSQAKTKAERPWRNITNE
jgi:hypothetical protein